MSSAIVATIKMCKRLQYTRMLTTCLAMILALYLICVSGCARPTLEAWTEAQADRERACEIAESYLEGKYGLSEGEVAIVAASPFYIGRGKSDLGRLDYIGGWDFEAEVRGETCLVSANLRQEEWADTLQHDELIEAFKKDLGNVIDYSRFGEVKISAGTRFNKNRGVENGLFDGESPFEPLKGRNFHIHAQLACYDEATVEEALEAVRAHYTDEVLQGTYLWIEVGHFPDGKFDSGQWQNIVTWQVPYYNYANSNPYPRDFFRPGET